MSVIEKFSTISNNITKLIEFVSKDDTVKEDFNDYMTSISAQNLTQAQVQAMIIPYVFERRITDERKSIIDIYIEKNPKINKYDKEVIKALGESFSSVFEIKKVLQNGFELYNLVNEMTYKVLSLVKMTNYRGVFAEQYAVCRLFKFEDEFYVLEISNVISKINKEEVQRYAIAKIIEEPENVYLDNPEKLQEIEKQVKIFNDKFIECFKTDEIITTNKCADNIINIFNNYCESDEFNQQEVDENIQPIEEYKFFHVNEFNNSYSNFVEKSLGGFSSHNAVYDVGIIYDEELGLFAIPFYATLSKIFETQDYKSISGYEACIKGFLENDKIPNNVMARLAAKYDNFTARVNEVLGTSYSYDELVKHYKQDSVSKKIFSPTSVLYSSKVFGELMGFVVESTQEQPENSDYQDVGRNEPCPCGSGKKYKKCCMK